MSDLSMNLMDGFFSKGKIDGKLMDEETQGDLFNFIFDQPLDLP